MICIAVLIVGIIVCGVYCIASWLSVESLVLYMVAKGYTLPSEEETEACMKEVVRRRFKSDR